jgi:hypothetical protein
MTDNSFSKKQVNRAGEFLAAEGDKHLGEFSASLSVAEWWRVTHVHPMRVYFLLLGRVAKLIDPKVTVSRRLKRMKSMVLKLSRNPNMQLARMQDVGGCRAVMESIEQVKQFVEPFRELLETGNRQKSEESDYIARPKQDGYRSIHVVVKYQPKSNRYAMFSDRRIEIQIRTRLQHAWATAVETVDFFLNQNLKLGGGDLKWRRFFALAATVFATEESCPPVPGTPPSVAGLHAELKLLWHELLVLERLSAWATALKFSETVVADDMYLLETDIQQKKIKITGWPLDDIEEAHDAYSMAEHRIASNPNQSAVLASAASLSDLRKAFPNYFGDTTVFINRFRGLLKDWR